MEIGKYNILKVNRRTDNGIYLLDEQNGQEVLLPNKFVNDKMVEGTWGKVFVYRDSEDRIVATKQIPLAIVGEVAYLTVKEVSPIGAFLDWGLDKDLLLPFSEQNVEAKAGDKVFVYVYLDRANQRIVASEDIGKFIRNIDVQVKVGDEVDLLVGPKHDRGYRVIINQMYRGILYDNEIFKPIASGERVKGYIKKLRDDGKIDVALQKQGIIVADDARELILEKLKQNGGKLPLSDSSSPEEIYAALGLSKKNFKKAIGMLYKEKKIEIGENFIKLR